MASATRSSVAVVGLLTSASEPVQASHVGQEREAKSRHPAFPRMNGMDVRRWMVLRADEHLDRVNPEECSGHGNPNNLSDRFTQRFSPAPCGAQLSTTAPWKPAGALALLSALFPCLAIREPHSAGFLRVSRLFPRHPPVKPLSVRPARGVWSSEVGVLSAPTPSSRHGRAGTVEDAEGTAKRREPKANVLDGPEHRGTASYPQSDYPLRKVQVLLDSNFRARIAQQKQ